MRRRRWDAYQESGRIIAAPGLWAQRITTKEPDDKMIEVAIEAMKAVIPDDGTDILNNK